MSPGAEILRGDGKLGEEQGRAILLGTQKTTSIMGFISLFQIGCRGFIYRGTVTSPKVANQGKVLIRARIIATPRCHVKQR